jgi:hypothetical protein
MTRPYRVCPTLIAKRRARWETMATLYKSGLTLQQIGDQFGCTREYIRQCMRKVSVSRFEGGVRKTKEIRREKFEARRNSKALKHWGCNWDQYVELRALKKPTRGFHHQRQNAKKRGIGWEFNLWEWWSIWQQSGKWSQRGRGQGYVMCRKGDVGPYSIDNVFIAPARVNSSDQARKKNGLPIGVRKNKKFKGYTAFRSINGKKFRLGSHPTPELAHAAYLAAGDRHTPTPS